MSLVKTYEHGNTKLELHNDEHPDSPRNWDNLGKMICSHKRYDLGDKHNFNPRDYNSLDEFKKDLTRKEDVAVMLPLYLYDHSGITMKTTPFGDRWDSGQVGFIIATKEAIRKEYGVKRVTKKLLKQVTSILEGEVETYDQFLTGDTYGFKLFVNGVETDACWGFYGSDIKTNGILDHINEPELEETIKLS